MFVWHFASPAPLTDDWLLLKAAMDLRSIDNLAQIAKYIIEFKGYVHHLTIPLLIYLPSSYLTHFDARVMVVTQAIHLGFGAEKNVAFFFKFNCTPGAQPVVAGVDDNGGQYIPLFTGKCP